MNGLASCPTCKESIVGWEAIRQVRSTQLVVEKMGEVDRVPTISTTGSEDFQCKGVEKTALNTDDRAEVMQGEEYSDEEDNMSG